MAHNQNLPQAMVWSPGGGVLGGWLASYRWLNEWVGGLFLMHNINELGYGLDDSTSTTNLYTIGLYEKFIHPDLTTS